MNNFVIQLQNLEQIETPFERIQELANKVDSKVKIVQGETVDGDFTTIHLATLQEPQKFWNDFKIQFLPHEDFAQNSMVVLQKDVNWLDYYLLHTWTDEELDVL